MSPLFALAATVAGLVAAAATARHQSLALIAGALLAYQGVNFRVLPAVAGRAAVAIR